MTTKRESGRTSFDWSPALTFFEGDKELLADVLEAFLEECPELMQKMDGAIERADTATLQRAAHIMAGALRIFGIEPAIDSAAQLEEMGRSKQLSRARPCYLALKSHIDQLLPAAAVFLKEVRKA